MYFEYPACLITALRYVIKLNSFNIKHHLYKDFDIQDQDQRWILNIELMESERITSEPTK